MKGLNKLVLVSAIAAISAGANAELKALDDSTMGELTGQAGLTIDLETKWTIGEFAFHDTDGGSVLFQGLSMGGNNNVASATGVAAGLAAVTNGTMLDNIRLTLDVAGAGEALNYGFSDIEELAGVLAVTNSNADTTIQAIAANNPAVGVDDKKVYGDGDLVIHFTATDHLAVGGGYSAFLAGTGDTLSTGRTNATLGDITFDEAKELVVTAVDFGFSIDAIKLASSDYVIGSGVSGTDAFTGAGNSTTLISGLSINGYLGPVDIHIENNGNGFNAAGEADSKIHWDSYTNITDLDVYIDIVGLRIENLKINNVRGDTTNISGVNSSFGFAHSMQTIYAMQDNVLTLDAATNTVSFTDGIAIDTIFKGDMEIGALSFGDTGTSIGELYWTDINSTTNWVISAH